MSDEKATDFMSMVTPDVTNLLMERSNYTEISNKQMARLLNLNEHEIKFIDMFWNKVQNNDWILVTRELVTTYLSNETSAYVMKNFINRRLVNNSDLINGIDYQEVDSNHILVRQYENRWSNLTSAPANKQYYIITIKTFKHLLMRSNTTNSYNYREYMLKLEHLIVIASNYNARLMEHKNLQLTNEIKKYPQIHHLENERKVIADMARACNALNPAMYNGLIVLYVVALNEIVTVTMPDGTQVECPLNKLGYSDRIWNKRIGEHEREYNKCKLIYLQHLSNGLMAEQELKRRLKELKLRHKLKTREKGNVHNEIFYTTPEYNMTYIINEIHHICLPRQSISMKDKQISDLSTMVTHIDTQLKATLNENKKLLCKCENNSNELIESRIKLAHKSEECAVAQAEAKLYKDMVEKLLAVKKDEPEKKHVPESSSDDESEPEVEACEDDDQKLMVETIENKDKLNNEEESEDSDENKEIEESEDIMEETKATEVVTAVVIKTDKDKSKVSEESSEDLLKRTCPQCKKVYSNVACMRRHVRGKHENKYQKWCNECKKSFYDSGSYRKHVNEVHKQILKQQCPKCTKTYACKSTLDRHILNVHDGAKKECPECHKIMTDGALGVHMKVMHSDVLKVECEECGAILGDKKYLKAHIEQVHLKLEIKCTVCKSMVPKYQLNKHMHAKHPDEVVRRKRATPSEDTEESSSSDFSDSNDTKA